MAATRMRTFRLSHDLADAADLRAERLGYASGTDLIKALLRYDCLTQSSHGLTINWAKLPPAEQDAIDSKLLSRTLSKTGMTAQDAAQVDWKTL